MIAQPDDRNVRTACRNDGEGNVRKRADSLPSSTSGGAASVSLSPPPPSLSSSAAGALRLRLRHGGGARLSLGVAASGGAGMRSILVAQAGLPLFRSASVGPTMHSSTLRAGRTCAMSAKHSRRMDPLGPTRVHSKPDSSTQSSISSSYMSLVAAPLPAVAVSACAGPAAVDA